MISNMLLALNEGVFVSIYYRLTQDSSFEFLVFPKTRRRVSGRHTGPDTSGGLPALCRGKRVRLADALLSVWKLQYRKTSPGAFAARSIVRILVTVFKMASLGHTSSSMRSRGNVAGVHHSVPDDGYGANGAGESSYTPSNKARSSVAPDPLNGSAGAHSPPTTPNRATSLTRRMNADGKAYSAKISNKQGALSGTFGVPGAPVGGVSRAELRMLVLVVILAVFVRMYKLGQPTSVVFDEVHFGGFASKYVKQRFFMDVHPPLAKLMIAFVAWLAGFKGSFDFKTIGL